MFTSEILCYVLNFQNDVLALDNGHDYLAVLPEADGMTGAWKHVAVITVAKVTNAPCTDFVPLCRLRDDHAVARMKASTSRCIFAARVLVTLRGVKAI